VGTPLPPIKTAAQWAIQIKRLNLLARVRAEKEAAALAAGEQEAVPGASAAPAEAVVIPTEHILVIDKNADIILPSSGSDNNPVLNAPGFTIILKGEDGGTPVLKLGSGSTGTLLDIRENQTIILENLKLEGVYPNNAPLVKVKNSSLELKDGTEVTGNENTTGTGGGIYLDGGSLLAGRSLLDGQGPKITGNTASGGSGKGGGIYAKNGSDITLEDGAVISDNSSNSGGGIYITGGSQIKMNGSSAISRNTAASGNGSGVYCDGSVVCSVEMNGNSVIGGFQQSDGNIGGGVSLYGGPHILVMNDNAAIAYNNARGGYGAGVLFVSSNGSNTAKITMTGNAVIRNNTTTSELGGGMCIMGKTNVTLSENAKIGGAPGWGNSCTGSGQFLNLGGGGIYFSSSSSSGSVLYIRDNAEISHNYARARGGGVYKGTQSTRMITFTEGVNRVFSNTSGTGDEYADIHP
jgi:hypothetical protein